jgi:hypothetical protein
MSAIFTDTHHSTLLGISFVSVIQFCLTTIIGGAVGVAVGEVIHSHVRIKSEVAKTLRIGMWIPVFLLWFIPVVNVLPSWLNEILPTVMVVTSAAVAMATLRNHILGWSVLRADRSDVLRLAVRTALIQALIVCLFSQAMMSGAGWHWFAGGLRQWYRRYLSALCCLF